MVVLTLEGEHISAITWFGGNAFPHFGLPRVTIADVCQAVGRGPGWARPVS
jgi:hypothetical protein